MKADGETTDDVAFNQEGSWPRLIVFVIPLRDPLPIAHGSTFLRAYNDNPIDELTDVAMKPTKDHPISYPRKFSGRRFVSLRVWQLSKPADQMDVELLKSASSVLEAITGNPRTPDESERIPGLEPTYQTVIEAVTIVKNRDDVYARDGKPDPLTRCVSALIEHVRAYRIGKRARISELTYERILPFVPFIWREVFSERYLGGPSLMMLSHFNVTVPGPSIMKDGDMERYSQALERLVAGDPLLIYTERALEAEVALFRDGQYADAAVQAAIAAEVLLDSILGMMIWEESLKSDTTENAITALSLDSTKRIRSCYHPRIGGNWHLDDGTPVGRWYSTTAALRNRVVHRGYRPTLKEVHESFDALRDLEKFICDRLAANRSKYPRATLAMLGRDGLDRRGRWSDAVFSVDAIGDIADCVREYARWRDRIDPEIHLRRRSTEP